MIWFANSVFIKKGETEMVVGKGEEHLFVPDGLHTTCNPVC
jgi:hypothetical protein